MKRRTETEAVHAGRSDLRRLGVHAPPIDLSTTYPIDDLLDATESLDAMAAGGHPVGNPIYGRLHNPTVARFERALASLEGAQESVAFGSGMAALTASLLAARQDGEHVVAVRPLYGGSDHLLATKLLGLDVTWSDSRHVRAAVTPETSLVVIETPANPTLDVVDIASIVAQANGVPVLVDSTFATPVLQKPLEHGASLVLHSATKFLGGHGDLIGGVVATSKHWAERLRQVRAITGALLHPIAGYMLHRGLQTLPLRVRRAQASAKILVSRIAHHPAVGDVFYPGLIHRGSSAAFERQMKGPGALFAFELVGGLAAAAELLRHLRVFTPAVSLGSTDSLIEHPAGLTHRLVDPDARQSCGISDGLLRVSVGLEHPDDLWRDLYEALDCALRVAPSDPEMSVAG